MLEAANRREVSSAPPVRYRREEGDTAAAVYCISLTHYDPQLVSCYCGPRLGCRTVKCLSQTGNCDVTCLCTHLIRNVKQTWRDVSELKSIYIMELYSFAWINSMSCPLIHLHKYIWAKLSWDYIVLNWNMRFSYWTCFKTHRQLVVWLVGCFL